MFLCLIGQLTIIVIINIGHPLLNFINSKSVLNQLSCSLGLLDFSKINFHDIYINMLLWDQIKIQPSVFSLDISLTFNPNPVLWILFCQWKIRQPNKAEACIQLTNDRFSFWRKFSWPLPHLWKRALLTKNFITFRKPNLTNVINLGGPLLEKKILAILTKFPWFCNPLTFSLNPNGAEGTCIVPALF